MTYAEKIKQAAAELAAGYRIGSTVERAFIEGVEWAQANPNWIPVSEQLPEPGQRVLFVVDVLRSDYHGQVFGGRYTGSADFPNSFGVPGIGWEASFWMPAPEPPAQEGGNSE
ncbi:DUF551 domain-containing protein [Chitinophaga sp. sic0106]|uniref:DUF551 domain-containing protein n=1 Tax=Chitinophaga sp. sic0106 TaxID=2854785 RepID=UPI001C49379D|nr:DUF551 domain-containing protein [Chitinophaga sp. sic0106]MBV7531307.1 DUF551 domain-containing protein [Chitinophaga sp. sic0106]